MSCQRRSRCYTALRDVISRSVSDMRYANMVSATLHAIAAPAAMMLSQRYIRYAVDDAGAAAVIRQMMADAVASRRDRYTMYGDGADAT